MNLNIYKVLEYAKKGNVVEWDEKNLIFKSKVGIITEEYLRVLFRDCIRGLYYSN